MNKYLSAALKFILFLGLGVFLIWLAVKNLTEEDQLQIKNCLLGANYWWIGLSMIIGIFSHLSRSLRWKMLLAPLGFVPKFSNTFYAVMTGYLGNLALPRLGEVLRCGILKRYEKIPFTQSFGTVIAERVIDLFMLFLLFTLSAWIEYERMHVYLSEHILTPLKLKLHSFTQNKATLILLIGIFIAAILLLIFFRKKIFQNAIAQKIKTLLLSFWAGIHAVAKVKNPALFIFHSLFIWAMYLSSVYVCVFAFAETKMLSLADCLVIMAFGSIGVIATPGGIGAYQWIVLQIMALWGFTAATGVAFGWIVWLAQTLVVLLLGLLSFALLAINNKEGTTTEVLADSPPEGISSPQESFGREKEGY